MLRSRILCSFWVVGGGRWKRRAQGGGGGGVRCIEGDCRCIASFIFGFKGVRVDFASFCGVVRSGNFRLESGTSLCYDEDGDGLRYW